MLPVCDDVLKLLPQLNAVEVGSVEVFGDAVVVSARSQAEPAACTGCGQISDWEHSRYVRHVADEAVGGRPRPGGGGDVSVHSTGSIGEKSGSGNCRAMENGSTSEPVRTRQMNSAVHISTWCHG